MVNGVYLRTGHSFCFCKSTTTNIGMGRNCDAFPTNTTTVTPEYVFDKVLFGTCAVPKY